MDKYEEKAMEIHDKYLKGARGLDHMPKVLSEALKQTAEEAARKSAKAIVHRIGEKK